MLHENHTLETPAIGSATAPAKPKRIRRRLVFKPMTCKGCAVTFTPARCDQDFCDHACRARWWAKARRRGGMVYGLLCELRIMRKVKGGTKGLLNEISRTVDEWLAEDKAAGIKPWIPPKTNREIFEAAARKEK